LQKRLLGEKYSADFLAFTQKVVDLLQQFFKGKAPSKTLPIIGKFS
jgi:hypothetical protein